MPLTTPVLNAMTVDVEDYFHVSAFASVVLPEQWEAFESRVCGNTERLLAIFERRQVRATFFVLGWVAERFPALVKRIHREGHEIASHSFDHGLVYDKTPEAFLGDLRRSCRALEDATGERVRGYRAPSYSVTAESLWALDVLIGEGFAYDSSIYPIRHDRYGLPSWPRHVQRVERDGGALWELPGSTVRHGGVNWPVGGGGYFRLLPYRWTRYGIRRLNVEEQQPAVFYVHPWEIDPDQPRLNGTAVSRWRHYTNLHRTEERLERLLDEFRFGTVSEMLDERASCLPDTTGHGLRRRVQAGAPVDPRSLPINQRESPTSLP